MTDIGDRTDKKESRINLLKHRFVKERAKQVYMLFGEIHSAINSKNMKKAILGLWLGLIGLSAAAQNSAPAGMADMDQVSTNEEIRSLANQLRLNEGQYIRLRDLSKARQEQIAEINSMYSNDPAMRQAKIQAAQQEFDSQLAQSIGQKSFTAYLQLQGRNPDASGAAYQAGGYGGRSLEEGTTMGTADEATQTPATTAPAAEPLDTNIDQGRVDVTERVIKVNTDEGEMKVKAKKEKVETADMEYKADRDEVKIKSKDGKIKAKSEKGKTKVETPKGKMKMKNGEVKVNPKKG
jgi:hypothetical protein